MRASATAHSIKVTRNSTGKWSTQQFTTLVHVFHDSVTMSLDLVITCNFDASAPYIVLEKNLLTHSLLGTERYRGRKSPAQAHRVIFRDEYIYGTEFGLSVIAPAARAFSFRTRTSGGTEGRPPFVPARTSGRETERDRGLLRACAAT